MRAILKRTPWFLVGAWLVACNTGPQRDGGDDDDDTTGSGSGAGGGSGVGGGGGQGNGGPTTPHEICAQYLECLADTSPAELAIAIDAYGDQGTCWQGAPELCEDACLTGLGQHHGDAESCPECFEQAHCDTGLECTAGSCTQPCPDAVLGSTLPQTLNGTLVGAIDTHDGCGGYGERVYEFTAPTAGSYFIEVTSPTFTASLGRLTGGCGGSVINCAAETFYTPLSAGELLTILVERYDGEEGPFTLTISNQPL